MGDDETYCIYVEKSHAIFIIFTIVVIFIIAIISENIVEAGKIIAFAAIPVILLLVMDTKTYKYKKPAERHPEERHNHTTTPVVYTQPAPIFVQPSPIYIPQPQMPHHNKNKKNKKHFSNYPGAVDSDSSSDEEEEDKYRQHSSSGSYGSYDNGPPKKDNFYTNITRQMMPNIDDYLASSKRNTHKRATVGSMTNHNQLKGYYANEFNEGRDWWGNNDY